MGTQIPDKGRRRFIGASLVAGSKADTLFWSKEVYEKANEPKELCLLHRDPKMVKMLGEARRDT